ncbi:MAG: (4Fe-4S)-binding protein [Pseudomonadota bacterium]
MVKTDKKKIIKIIKVNADKCNGCRVCEMVCASSHSVPKYSSTNPDNARIRVIRDPFADKFIPVFAGVYTKAECIGRQKYTIAGREYDECEFCNASCRVRELFKEPDSGLPLKCDKCEGEEEPLCVKWCYYDALTCEVREEEHMEEPVSDNLETGLESLADRYGVQKLLNTVRRLLESKNFGKKI